jgi:hypothetical protein
MPPRRLRRLRPLNAVFGSIWPQPRGATARTTSAAHLRCCNKIQTLTLPELDVLNAGPSARRTLGVVVAALAAASTDPAALRGCFNRRIKMGGENATRLASRAQFFCCAQPQIRQRIITAGDYTPEAIQYRTTPGNDQRDPAVRRCCPQQF